MTLSDELWTCRATRLHGKFIEASEEYPRLYHVAVRTDVDYLWHWLLPVWDPEQAGAVIEDVTEFAARHEGTWSTTLFESRFQLRFSGTLIDEDPHRLRIQSEEWVGRFVDPDFEEGDMHAHEGIAHFCALSEEAISLLTMEGSPLVPSGSWFSEDPIWLEQLYRSFPQRPEDVSPMRVLWLPWNVFLTSAKTVEMLAANGEESNRPARVVESKKESGERTRSLLPENSDRKLPFVPTDLQKAILKSLEGRSLKKEQLAKECNLNRTTQRRKSELVS